MVGRRLTRRAYYNFTKEVLRLYPPFLLLIMLLYTSLHFSEEEGKQYVGGILLAWGGYLTLLFFDKTKRFFALFFGVLTAYNSFAWVAYEVWHAVYPPYPSESTIYRGTVLSLKAVIAAYLISSLAFFGFDWQRWVFSIANALGNRIKKANMYGIFASIAFLAGVSVIDYYRISQVGLVNILESPRRTYVNFLLSTGNHNIQLVAISVSTFGFLILLLHKGHLLIKAFLAMALFAYWLPFVLIGSRKELLIVFIATVGVYLFFNTISLGRRLCLGILALFVLLSMALLPAVRDGYIAALAHEWILPQYFLFSVMEKDIKLEGYNYLTGFWLMVPGFLRPIPVRDLGQTFASLHLTNVGVGAHPVAEAYINNSEFAVLLFAISTTFLLLAVRFLSKLSPAFGMLGIAYLLLWGRSDLWVTLFYLIYGGIVLAAMTALGIGTRISSRRGP